MKEVIPKAIELFQSTKEEKRSFKWGFSFFILKIIGLARSSSSFWLRDCALGNERSLIWSSSTNCFWASGKLWTFGSSGSAGNWRKRLSKGDASWTFMRTAPVFRHDAKSDLMKMLLLSISYPHLIVKMLEASSREASRCTSCYTSQYVSRYWRLMKDKRSKGPMSKRIWVTVVSWM